MRKRVRGSRVGEIVGRHVDRLDGRHRAGGRRGDPLLELAHLGRQRRLVADRARHTPEQCRHLGARLHEPEDVVDEEEHVLALVAEVLGHGQPREADAKTRARRLVHLSVDERDLVDHLGLGHLEQQVVPLARALPHAREDGDAAMLPGDVVDQLLDEHGLARPRAAEEPDLPASDERRDQVDHLDPGLEDLHLRREVAECGWVAVNRPALHALRRGPLVVDGIARHVPEATERRVADRDRDRVTRIRRRPSLARGRPSNPSRRPGLGRRPSVAGPRRSASPSFRRAASTSMARAL